MLRFFNKILLFPITTMFVFTSYAADIDRPWVAVHDFTVSKDLKKLGINGWNVAGKIENRLVQKGVYRIVTRAKIAKVLKEKNLNSSSKLGASEFGKMVGSEFIVTGQINNTGRKITLIGKLIDVKGESGEVEKSYDISVTGKTIEDSISKLPELYNDLADDLSMTPGDFLNEGITAMNDGNYVKAIKAFQEVKRLVPLQEIRELMSTPATPFESATIRSLSTPGDLLDYGLKAMSQGNKNRAYSAFKKFEKITPYEQIKNLFEVGKILKRAEKLAQKQKGEITNTIEKAASLFLNAQKNQAEIESNMTPAELCDKALLSLESILVNPKIYLSSNEKVRIEELIHKIKEYRKTLFAGPVFGKIWILPDLNIELLPIKEGDFEMGDEAAISNLAADNPMHFVNISSPFWIGKTEITIEEFLFFLKDASKDKNIEREIIKTINWSASYTPIRKNYKMKRGKSKTWGNKKQPIVGISWEGAEQFCKWLTNREINENRLPDGYIYRLPTEAEWEYACRAGTKSDYYYGNDSRDLYEFAVYRNNSNKKTSVVGSKKPNNWGIYDMHGNVWEWCLDWYNGAYEAEEITDPLGPEYSKDNLKVLKGGSYASSPKDLKSSTRYSFRFKGFKKNVGFRIVLAPEL